MGFQFSAVFDMMWNHPLVCGSILLLLTPSLFHILIYFSPLLISTTLFIIALISMKPRMEETTEERERWAKGERTVAGVVDDGWPYGEWSQASDEAAAVKKQRLEDGSRSWIEVIEEGKIKLAAWVDNVFKSGDLKPLVSSTDAVGVVSAPAKKKKEEEAVDHPARAVAVASKPKEPVPIITPEEVISNGKVVEIEEIEKTPPVVETVAPVVETKKEFDMPELETVETASLEEVVAASEKIAGKKSQEPIWDEAPATPAQAEESLPLPVPDDELLDVPLHEPVQESLISENLEAPVVDKAEELFFKEVADNRPRVRSPSKEDEAGGAASKSPSQVFKVSSTIAPRDVHNRIFKEFQTKMNELDAKRRNKYNQILSRRMSTKNSLLKTP